MRRTRGFVELLLDLVEETTRLVERTQTAVVRRTVRRFAPVEPLKGVAEQVARTQTAIAGGVCASIRGVNDLTRLAVDALAELNGANDLPAADLHGGELHRLAVAGGQCDSLCTPCDLPPNGSCSVRCCLATPLNANAAGTASWTVDQVQAVINGFWGDALERRGNGLDLGMTVRHHGRRLPLTRAAFSAAFGQPTAKLCVFVHSLAATEWLWSLSAARHYGDPAVTFGTRLHDDLGFTPLYLRYNTGRHISTNGRALAALLAEVLRAYPLPVEEIALVGHSMGGLVARSAAHYAHAQAEPWVAKLRHVVSIATPHLGAPLEQAVNLVTGLLRHVEAAGAQVPAAVLDARSAGVKDLRYGYTVDEEWLGRDPDQVFANARRQVPPVDGVDYSFLAATIARDPHHPLGRWLGDLMVLPPSASGAAPNPARRVSFTGGAFLPGLHHLEVANHPAVYAALRELLSAPPPHR